LNNGLKIEVQEIKFVLSYEFDNPEACFELVLGHFLSPPPQHRLCLDFTEEGKNLLDYIDSYL